METLRLTPWEKHSLREWRRSVITPYGNVALLRVWGRNKRGVAEWYWSTIVPGYQALPIDFLKGPGKHFHHPHNAPPKFLRKMDAVGQADAAMRAAGILLLKNKHLPFL